MVQHREGLFSIPWVPSHVDTHGDEVADKLAEEGRRRHQACCGHERSRSSRKSS